MPWSALVGKRLLTRLKGPKNSGTVVCFVFNSRLALPCLTLPCPCADIYLFLIQSFPSHQRSWRWNQMPISAGRAVYSICLTYLQELTTSPSSPQTMDQALISSNQRIFQESFRGYFTWWEAPRTQRRTFAAWTRRLNKRPSKMQVRF